MDWCYHHLNFVISKFRPYFKCFTCEKNVAYLEDICCNYIGGEQKQAGSVVFRVAKLSEREIVWAYVLFKYVCMYVYLNVPVSFYLIL